MIGRLNAWIDRRIAEKVRAELASDHERREREKLQKWWDSLKSFEQGFEVGAANTTAQTGSPAQKERARTLMELSGRW